MSKLPYRNLFLKIDYQVALMTNKEKKRSVVICPRCNMKIRGISLFSHSHHNFCKRHQVTEKPDNNYKIEFIMVDSFVSLLEYRKS